MTSVMVVEPAHMSVDVEAATVAGSGVVFDGWFDMVVDVTVSGVVDEPVDEVVDESVAVDLNMRFSVDESLDVCVNGPSLPAPV